MRPAARSAPSAGATSAARGTASRRRRASCATSARTRPSKACPSGSRRRRPNGANYPNAISSKPMSRNCPSRTSPGTKTPSPPSSSASSGSSPCLRCSSARFSSSSTVARRRRQLRVPERRLSLPLSSRRSQPRCCRAGRFFRSSPRCSLGSMWRYASTTLLHMENSCPTCCFSGPSVFRSRSFISSWAPSGFSLRKSRSRAPFSGCSSASCDG